MPRLFDGDRGACGGATATGSSETAFGATAGAGSTFAEGGALTGFVSFGLIVLLRSGVCAEAAVETSPAPHKKVRQMTKVKTFALMVSNISCIHENFRAGVSKLPHTLFGG